jgi:hypothetical protein
MELKLLEITNSKPPGPINVSDNIKAFANLLLQKGQVKSFLSKQGYSNQFIYPF